MIAHCIYCFYEGILFVHNNITLSYATIWKTVHCWITSIHCHLLLPPFIWITFLISYRELDKTIKNPVYLSIYLVKETNAVSNMRNKLLLNKVLYFLWDLSSSLLFYWNWNQRNILSEQGLKEWMKIHSFFSPFITSRNFSILLKKKTKNWWLIWIFFFFYVCI